MAELPFAIAPHEGGPRRSCVRVPAMDDATAGIGEVLVFRRHAPAQH